MALVLEVIIGFPAEFLITMVATCTPAPDRFVAKHTARKLNMGGETYACCDDASVAMVKTMAVARPASHLFVFHRFLSLPVTCDYLIIKFGLAWITVPMLGPRPIQGPRTVIFHFLT